VEEIKFGQYALPVILTVVLGIVYKVVPFPIPDRFKALVAVALGIGLSLLWVPYSGLPWTIVHVVDYVLHGLMVGASAVGLYELQRTVTKPRK